MNSFIFKSRLTRATMDDLRRISQDDVNISQRHRGKCPKTAQKQQYFANFANFK